MKTYHESMKDLLEEIEASAEHLRDIQSDNVEKQRHAIAYLENLLQDLRLELDLVED